MIMVNVIDWLVFGLLVSRVVKIVVMSMVIGLVGLVICEGVFL